MTVFPLPRPGSLDCPKNSHMLPIALAIAVGLGAVAIVAYLLWPTWSTENAGAPDRLPISIGGTLFNVPAAAMRVKIQRHSGQQERIDLNFSFPSLEVIELQDSAYPYHDWNERVTAECYAPNAISRLLDDQQRIVKLVNNYSQMSFNFGPTLLLWMEQNAPAVLESIREADKQSQTQFGGHGSAIAQVYNHMILPLANERDARTQIESVRVPSCDRVYDLQQRQQHTRISKQMEMTFDLWMLME